MLLATGSMSTITIKADIKYNQTEPSKSFICELCKLLAAWTILAHQNNMIRNLRKKAPWAKAAITGPQLWVCGRSIEAVEDSVKSYSQALYSRARHRQLQLPPLWTHESRGRLYMLVATGCYSGRQTSTKCCCIWTIGEWIIKLDLMGDPNSGFLGSEPPVFLKFCWHNSCPG